ncbi:MAG: aminoacyl-tRNA hydrolase [bacterium]
MMMNKQVIVVRKDLNMRKGKIAAQVAHAAMKVFLDRGRLHPASDPHKYAVLEILDITQEMAEWVDGAFTKIVVGVNSEQEIYDLANKAKQENIPYAIIIDNGFTEFSGNKTTTCIAIGPDNSEKINKITGDLELI